MTGNICSFLLIFAVCLILTNGRLEHWIIKKEILAVVNDCIAGNFRTLAGIFGRTCTVCNCDYIPI